MVLSSSTEIGPEGLALSDELNPLGDDEIPAADGPTKADKANADKGTSQVAEPVALEQVIEEHVRRVLLTHDGNRSAAARALEISRNRLARLLDSSDD